MNIDDSVIKYIAENIKGNIRELEGAISKVVALGRLSGNEITMDLAVDALKYTISPDNKPEITPESIIHVVCDHFSISRDDLVGSKRNKELVYPRHITMYLMRNMTNTSLEQIGAILGGRDHTTVLHGINKISTDEPVNKDLAATLDVIRKKISPT